jgi:hypothetical protein
VFLFLFENEDSFRYISSQRKYQCTFEGAVKGERLKNIFKYDEILFRENTCTSTRGISYLRIMMANIKQYLIGNKRS